MDSGMLVYALPASGRSAMLAIFIQAIRLCYRVEARSPDRCATRTGIPRNADDAPCGDVNWKVARDAETQALAAPHEPAACSPIVAGFALWLAGAVVG